MSDQGDHGQSSRKPPTIDLTATEMGRADGNATQGAAEAQTGARANDGMFSWLPPDPPWSVIGAAAGGACAVIILAVALWLGGTFHERKVEAPNPLPQIEAQLRDIAARAPADARAIEELSARLGKIETALSVPRSDPALDARVAAAEGAARAAADGIAGLRSQIENLARVQRAAAPDNQAGRLAAAAVALRDAAERGTPFAVELAAARALAPESGPLDALQPLAASGLASNQALAQELSALVPALLDASAAPAPGGFLEKIQANAEQLVRVRPIGEAAGQEPAQVIARIEARAARGDVDNALTELKALPASARAPAQAWIAKAESRNVALAAARDFAKTSLAALARPGP